MAASRASTWRTWTNPQPQPGLAAEYLLMAAMLIEIKSRMLLPPQEDHEGTDGRDPRAELVPACSRARTDEAGRAQQWPLPQHGRDFLKARCSSSKALQPRFPMCTC